MHVYPLLCYVPYVGSLQIQPCLSPWRASSVALAVASTPRDTQPLWDEVPGKCAQVWPQALRRKFSDVALFAPPNRRRLCGNGLERCMESFKPWRR